MDDRFYNDYIKPRLTKPMLAEPVISPQLAPFVNSYPDLQSFLEATVNISKPVSETPYNR